MHTNVTSRTLQRLWHSGATSLIGLTHAHDNDIAHTYTQRLVGGLLLHRFPIIPHSHQMPTRHVIIHNGHTLIIEGVMQLPVPPSTATTTPFPNTKTFC